MFGMEKESVKWLMTIHQVSTNMQHFLSHTGQLRGEYAGVVHSIDGIISSKHGLQWCDINSLGEVLTNSVQA